MKLKKNRRIKSGRLHQFHLDCPDLERFILRRLARRLNLVYIPFTLRFYDEVFLREDYTKQNRMVVIWCKKRGIKTYVVQEGGAKYFEDWQTAAQCLLHADYFVCPEECKEFWIRNGMPSDRILTFKPEKEVFSGILFIENTKYYENRLLIPEYYRHFNSRTIRVIEDFIEKDVVFKPHPRGDEFIRKILPPHRIVDGEAEELIKKYDKIYCFPTSTIRVDCEKLNKKYTVVGQE